ncbi:unnamed protein product [Taenia asiatica]|uniref:Miff domain-containing protein n=1 Tax=Taenia asiatica TaxID=60517 RepID=A0A0R3W7G6_TAEAS|nr:unnamed protein product [Taenia asiatica]
MSVCDLFFDCHFMLPPATLTHTHVQRNKTVNIADGMNAFYYRSKSVEVSPDLNKPTKPIHFIVLAQARGNNFCMQRPPPSEQFEVIPMLCQVKRISPCHAQSESGVSLALQRPPHSSRFLMISSSSAPPRGPARPRFFTNRDGRSERCRQLERTIRDQEKIIALQENELQRMRSRESEYSISSLFKSYQTVIHLNALQAFPLQQWWLNDERWNLLKCRKQTPLRGGSRLSTPMRGGSAPLLPFGLSGDISVSPSIDSFYLHSHSSPPQLQPSLPPAAPADSSSVPVLARRVHSLVRDIREETEASLLRYRDRPQAQREQY